MSNIIAVSVRSFSLTLLLLAGLTGGAAEPIQIGVAETDITPPLGYPMAGYYHERLATGVRDPLKAKAMVFRQGETQAALVVCDLTGIAVDLSTHVRRRASEKTGIPVENIIVSATHSHTAPDYTQDLYEHLGGESGGRTQSGAPRPPYAGKLIENVVRAIEEAHASAHPATVRAGSTTQQTPVSFCRRFVMRDGSIRTWQALSNPEVVRPAGPIDPEIGLINVSSESGEPLGLVSSFALHLDTVGGHQWSADYPYYIEQAARESLGPKAVSLFGLGCCGDINHSNPAATERNKTDFIGNSLAATVREALPNLAPIAQPTLQVRSATVQVPLEEVNEAQVRRAVETLAAFKSGTKIDFFDHVTAYKRIILDHLQREKPFVNAAEHVSWGLSRTWQGVGPTLPVEVQVISLGEEAAIVCLPGEVFVELGLAIKQASPFRTTLVVELSQCVETVYIPTRANYPGGGYEVTNSMLQPGSGEMLVEAAVRLLREAAAATVRATAAKPK